MLLGRGVAVLPRALTRQPARSVAVTAAVAPAPGRVLLAVYRRPAVPQPSARLWTAARA